MMKPIRTVRWQGTRYLGSCVLTMIGLKISQRLAHSQLPFLITSILLGGGLLRAIILSPINFYSISDLRDYYLNSAR